MEGEAFHRGSVQVMAREQRDVPERLRALVRKDLVRPDRAVLSGDEAFRFRHLLIRDAAYEALAKTDRAELHERFARWLEERGAGLAELDEIVGYHLEQAFRYRCDLGPANHKARRLAADAAAHLDATGRRALDRGDTGAALNLLERAEALLPPQALDRALQESLIRGLGESGRIGDAISRAARVADQCAAAGDRVGELRARLAGLIWRVSLDPERWFGELRALVEEARPVIEQDGDAAARAALEHAAGFVDLALCRNAAASAEYARAMEHARQAGDRWFEASIRGRAASALGLGPTSRNQALRWLENAEAQSATYQPGLKLALAAIQAELGHFGEARRLVAETVAQMNERGMHLSAALAMHAAWDCEMLAGEHAAAEQAIRHGCEQLERLGEHSYLSTYACELAEALYALGRYEESEQWALRGLELGSKDDLATQLFGLSVRSRLLARKGDLAAALALAEQVDALAASSEDPRDPGDAALNRAELMHLTGERAKAEAMTRRAIDCYQRNGATARAPSAGQTMGRLQFSNIGKAASEHRIRIGEHAPDPQAEARRLSILIPL